MADVTKEGLSEKKPIEGKDVEHDRHGPNQTPKKDKEKVSKGGKSFTLR